MATENPTASTYTKDIQEVIDDEKQYLSNRRTINGLEDDPDKAPVGLAISGGGIRSATFALGVIQGLTQGLKFKYFDYMSTVSGGGYIGACLSSLLSNNYNEEADGAPTPGVHPENSPFVGLNPPERPDQYKYAEEEQLSVRSQMHHLRTHGEYLAPRKGILSRDLKRMIGSVFAGMFHNIMLFFLLMTLLVGTTHLLLALLTNNTFLQEVNINYNIDKTLPAMDYIQALTAHWAEGFTAIYYKAWRLVGTDWHIFVGFLVLGGFWCLLFILIAGRFSQKFYGLSTDPPPPDAKSGYGLEEYHESRLLSMFKLSTITLMFGLTIWVMCIYSYTDWLTIPKDSNHLMLMFLPFSFSIGTMLMSLCINLRKSLPAIRVLRSVLSTIQGQFLYFLLFTFLVPTLVIIILTLHLDKTFIVSIASVLISYFAIKKNSDTGGFTSKLFTKYLNYTINFLVTLMIITTFIAISSLFLRYYAMGHNPENISYTFTLVVLGCTLLLFLFLGFFVDSNRVSPHYFYRDRLIEAYFKTDTRFRRKPGNDNQGMPLRTVRNNEYIKLTQLGEDYGVKVNGKKQKNNSGPYHIIVTALNLQGSDELNRKTMLSEHFIFSKYYVGSGVTGYVRTKTYRSGNTKLSRAITISAAAAGSAMGMLSFWGQAFGMTLFNIRLGNWMTNPWLYHDYDAKKAVNPKYVCNPEKGVFWPRYLYREMMNDATARTKLVNLSDGGHTGDNLALIPLIQRRCRLIVVIDGEADPKYTFESFNHAVRMAYIEENVDIEIELLDIVPEEFPKDDYAESKSSIAIGKIHYPSSGQHAAFTGTLVYIKASISSHQENRDGFLKQIKPPVDVFNYAKLHPSFPHQSTTDQFFDDAQFESYRALGRYIADQIIHDPITNAQINWEGKKQEVENEKSR